MIDLAHPRPVVNPPVGDTRRAVSSPSFVLAGVPRACAPVRIARSRCAAPGWSGRSGELA